MPPIDLNRLTFDLSKARLLAQFSRRAYNDSAGRSLAGAWRMMVHDPASDCRAFIEDCGNCIVVSFQGTRTAEQWITDAKFLMRAVASPRHGVAIKIHDGFLCGVDALLPKIVAVLLPEGAFKAKLKPIIVTGHSLGAALAELCGFFLQTEYFPVHAVYNYGCPRVGNAAWAAAYDSLLGKKTFRIVNQQDIVPRVPGVLMGYRHVGQEYFIPSTGLRMEFNPKFWALAVSDALGIFRDFTRDHHLSLIADHDIDDYIAALNKVSYLFSYLS